MPYIIIVLTIKLFHKMIPSVLLLTRTMEASSSVPSYLKPMRCLRMSVKYSLASLDVLVPKPGLVEK